MKVSFLRIGYIVFPPGGVGFVGAHQNGRGLSFGGLIFDVRWGRKSSVGIGGGIVRKSGGMNL